jgi:hypothetical protein
MLKWKYDSITREMCISQFSAYTGAGTVIVFAFYGKVPDETTTTPIKITTYQDSLGTVKLDEDNINASLTLTAVGAPIRNAIIANTAAQTISQSDTTKTDVTFSFQPSTSIAAASLIKIKFPLDDLFITPPASSTSCQVWNGSALVNSSPNCIYDSTTRILTMTTPGVTYAYGINTQFKIVQMINVPKVAKSFYLDISIYSSGGTTLVESYTQIIAFTPAALTAFTYTSVPFEKSAWAYFD